MNAMHFSGVLFDSPVPCLLLTLVLDAQSKAENDCWFEKVKEAAHESQKLLLNGPKAIRKTSTDDSVTPSRPRGLRQMHSVPPTSSSAVMKD